MRIGRGLHRIAAAVAVVAFTVLPAASAAAEPPFRVPTQITDNVGALSGGDRADVQAALDELSTDAGVNLFVVYVDTFDNPSRQRRLGGADRAAVQPGQQPDPAGGGHRRPGVRGQRPERHQGQPEPATADRPDRNPAAAGRRRLGGRGDRRGQRLPGGPDRVEFDMVVGGRRDRGRRRRRLSALPVAAQERAVSRTAARPSVPTAHRCRRRNRWISCRRAACRP